MIETDAFQKAIDQASQVLSQADSIVVYAGAGMSADSGLDVFRGPEGLYKEMDDEPEDLFTARWFKTCPNDAWNFYWQRIGACLAAEPHAGYAALRNIVELLSLDCFIYTSNVDGLFLKAGFPPDKLLECHGNIFNIQCTASKGCEVWTLLERLSLQKIFSLAEKGDPLLCTGCGAMARPNVLLSDDHQWVSRPYWGQRDSYLRWERANRSERIVKLEVGAGTGPSSVRSESETFPGTLIRMSSEVACSGRSVIEINSRALEGLVKLEARISDSRLMQ